MATWPSLALGVLKGFLAGHGVAVRACHMHLETAARLGLGCYAAMADTWGAGEAVFGALLDPAEAPRLVDHAAAVAEAAGRPEAAEWVRTTALADVAGLVEEWLDRERPERYQLVGGSVGALQLCASLYLMRRIRERGHSGLRVLGGSALVGSPGRELLARCSDIDAVVDGEGEHALLSLVSADAEPAPPGVLRRGADGSPAPARPARPLNLERAPAPDLHEFFAAAARLGVPRTALTISLEHSRGCAWEHRTGRDLQGCTFCGLYRGAPSFRRKPVARVVAELEQAVACHRVLNAAFVDAYMPADYRRELLQGIAGVPADLTFFTEMRCDLDERTAAALAAAGASHLQLGVESFTTAILRRIDKGVTGAQTVHSVRLSQEHRLPVQYNLMVRIPGVPEEEIEELAELLPLLYGLRPPKVVDFYLDRNSRAFADPVAHGIDPASLDGERPEWIPASLGDGRISQVVPFRPAGPDVEAAWRRVEARVEAWRRRWRSARESRVASPLVWRDGGGWAMVIDQRGDEPKICTLEGVTHDVFRACSEVVTLRRLAGDLPQHPERRLTAALAALEDQGLVLRDGLRWVRLAVHAGRPPGAAVQGRRGDARRQTLEVVA